MLSSLAPVLAGLATAYGLVAAGSALLQVRTMAARRTSDDVSLAFLSLYVNGHLVWLVYGMSIASLPLIVVETVGLVFGGWALGLALHLRRADRAPRHAEVPAS
jgi:uncharacterized protein with PQ loop repeat